MERVIKILIFVFLCNVSINAFAIPDKPQFISASIIPDSVPTLVELRWIPSQDISVAGYLIIKFNETLSVYSVIDTVYGRETDFYRKQYDGTNYVPSKYRIKAFDSSQTFSEITEAHTTMKLNSITYEKCDSAINLTWTPYEGWNAVSKYRIYRREANSNYELIDSVTNTYLSYTDNDISVFETYYYYIEAISVNGNKATSNSINIFTESYIPPKYLSAEYATVLDNKVSLKFIVDSTAIEVEKYVIKRKDYRSYDQYLTIAEIENTGQKEILYTDSKVRVNDYSYSYKIASVTDCGVESLESNIATTILLEIEDYNDSFNEELNWSHYEYWPAGRLVYNVYNVYNDSSYFIGSVDYADSIFHHNISKIIENAYKDKVELGTDICYYVEAVSAVPDTNSTTNYSRSNIACIEKEPIVYIPNAFNPISVYEPNKTFAPVISMIQKEGYEMRIIDRFGNVIFKTNDVFEGWTGKSSKGKYVAQEVYTYYIKYTDHAGKKLSKVGNVTVFYR